MTAEEDDFCGLLEELNISVSDPARASVKAQELGQLTGKTRRKDKSDRATIETVLDRRTCQALIKLKNGGAFASLSGCIATGKEANVYQAVGVQGEDLAVKIYKTSILVFKDRKRYISGDYRFQRGYSAGNPRKMVQVWAEKEMRNLARLHAAGIPSPKPRALRMHVLLMDFLGHNGVPAPRLHDAELSEQQLQQHYSEAVLLVRKLYQECRLVHADLSEYNILVHQGVLYLLDVSQSVDLDHPYALDFLREDAMHVNTFFRRKGIATLTTRELFEFAVDPSISRGQVKHAMAAVMAVAQSRGPDEYNELDDAVFAQAFIPRRLEEVDDHEEDFQRLGAAQGADCEGIYYQVITGMKADMSGARLYPSICSQAAALQAHELQESEDDDSSLASAASSDGNSAAARAVSQGCHHAGSTAEAALGNMARCIDDLEDDTGSETCSATDADLSSNTRTEQTPGDQNSKEQRKAHKKAVKEANRERRTHKMPKHVKKKLMNKIKRR